MSAFFPFLTVFFFIFLVATGWRRVRHPEKVFRARKKSDQEGPLVMEASRLGRIRWVGAIYLIVGLGGLVNSGFQLGPRPKAVQALQSEGGALRGLIVKEGEKFLRSKSVVNMVIAARKGEQEIVVGFGRKSLMSTEPVSGDTFFEIGSITKTFTGILLARMIEEGLVKPEEPIYSLLPAEVKAPEWSKTVTFRHLTTHSSGLPRMPGGFFTPKRNLLLLMARDPYASFSEAEFFRAIERTSLKYETGKKSEYSNFGVGLLGYLLAKNAAGSYEEVIREKVLLPLGMNDTFIVPTSEQKQRLASGYSATLALGPVMLGRRASNWDLPNSLAGAGALRSNGKDMLKYLRVNMAPTNSPLSNAVHRSHQELFDAGSHGVGMNWIRKKPKEKETEQTIIWHNGGTGGYMSFMGFTEDGKNGVVVLCGSSTSVDGLGLQLLAALQKLD